MYSIKLLHRFSGLPKKDGLSDPGILYLLEHQFVSTQEYLLERKTWTACWKTVIFLR